MKDLHTKSFLNDDSPYDDSYFSFYFSDSDSGYLNSGFGINDGSNTVSFSGDSAADIQKLDTLINALKTFRDIAGARVALKTLGE